MTGNYWDYPTSTDTVPYSDQPPPGSDAPTQSNTANFYKDDSTANSYDDGYAVTGETSAPSNPFTDVRPYSTSLSPYGTFDQGGNVWEWNEAIISSSSRGLRGGSWSSDSYYLGASGRLNNDPANERYFIGFRVASVPEPSSLLYGGVAMLGLLCYRWFAS